MFFSTRTTHPRAASRRLARRPSFRKASDIQALHQKLFRRREFLHGRGGHARCQRHLRFTGEYKHGEARFIGRRKVRHRFQYNWW